jgi:transcriptional regulator with XRE-family HTH domain
METFGSRLRSLRQAKRLSLDALAAESGISKAYLWKLEMKPDANPSLEISQKLADCLEVGIGDLVPSQSQTPIEPQIPSSLREAAHFFGMTKQDMEDLARIRFRGGQPLTANGWGLLFMQLKETVRRHEEE